MQAARARLGAGGVAAKPVPQAGRAFASAGRARNFLSVLPSWLMMPPAAMNPPTNASPRSAYMPVRGLAGGLPSPEEPPAVCHPAYRPGIGLPSVLTTCMCGVMRKPVSAEYVPAQLRSVERGVSWRSSTRAGTDRLRCNLRLSRMLRSIAVPHR